MTFFKVCATLCLYNFIIDTCWVLQYWGIECVKLLFSPRFSSMFVGQICHVWTYCGKEMVYWLWLLGQLDFLHGSQYTYYHWLSLSRNDNNISLALLCKDELVMCTDKHCRTENKYQNIKDHNNKFPTSNDMLLLLTPFSINHLVFQLHCTFVHVILSAKWKIEKVWGYLFAFGFINETCLIKLSWLWMDIMSYTVKN